jgi:hypothetical protein
MDRRNINEQLRARIEPLAQHLFPPPEGHRVGNSWRAEGALDINLRTGLWGSWSGGTARMSRNLIDLWLFARKVDFKTAIGEICSWLGMTGSGYVVPIIQSPDEEPARKLYLPSIQKPTDHDLRRLSGLRAIKIPALRLAAERGFLWCFDDPGNGRAWLITDQARKSAIARRLDAQPWARIKAKSKTLKGSWGSWPIGTLEAKAFPNIALIEGGPDFLAAFQLICDAGAEDTVTPVLMTGATMRTPASALPHFADKRVRIMMHTDRSGISAAVKWEGQLKEVNAIVSGFDFSGLFQTNGKPVSDLNDFLRISPNSFELNRSACNAILNFSARRNN